MAFLDFLTSGNSNQPVSQQGLPPEHSSVARLLELLGGFTGIAPLAGIGYLADQPTEQRYNEAAWPRFKDMLAKSGVPQQKLDNLDLLPIQARVGAANQLWQASLQQQKQPSLMQWWQQTHAGGTPEQYEQFLAQSKQKPQKQSSLMDWWKQANPGKGPDEYERWLTQFKQGKNPQFDYWFQMGPKGETLAEKVLPKGSPPPGPDWRTATGVTAAGKGQGKPHEMKLVQTMDAEGHPISVWYDPVTTQPVPGAPPIRGHLSQAETAGLEATRSLVTDIPKLEAVIQPIVAGGPFKQANEYRKYKYSMFGLGGTPDPAYAEYFAQIGNIKSEMAKLQTSGTSRSMRLLEFIQDHIPKETDPPAVAVEKLRTLERGRFQSLTQAILGDIGDGSTPSGGVPDTLGTTSVKSTGEYGLPPMPPFKRARTIQLPNGDYRVQDTSGRWYQYDWTAGQWR